VDQSGVINRSAART